jgi:hypothetical protein
MSQFFDNYLTYATVGLPNLQVYTQELEVAYNKLSELIVALAQKAV